MAETTPTAATGDTSSAPAPWEGSASPESWMNAAPSDAQVALRRAQYPSQASQPQTTAPNPAQSMKDPGQLMSPGLRYEDMAKTALRPKHGGLVGVMDKIADALTGTTRPEIYTDDQGNEFVYHPYMSRGQQWARIGATALTGAAAGLAYGKGAGNAGKGMLAGVQVGEQAAGQNRALEKDLKQEANQDMTARANSTLLKMNVMKGAWEASRLQIQANATDAENSRKEMDYYTKTLGGKYIGSANRYDQLGNVLEVDPKLAENFMKKGTIIPVNTVDNTGHKGVSFVQMPGPDWKDEMLPEGTPFFTFNDTTGKKEERHSAPGMTAGQAADANHAATAADFEYRKKQQELTEGEERIKQTKQTTAFAAEKEPLEVANLKQERLEKVASTAKDWAEKRKNDMDVQTSPSADVESQAASVAHSMTAPSQLPKRSKDYDTIMRRANEIHMAETGKPLSAEDAEINYTARKKLIEEYTGTGGAATKIQSFDVFLQHAQGASESVNALRNTGSKLINAPLNKLEKLTGAQRSVQISDAITAMSAVRTEYETMLKNGGLTDKDKEEGQAILDDNASPAQVQTALKRMAETGMARMRGFDYTYARTTHEHVPDFISPEAGRAMQHFGLDPLDAYTESVGIKMKAPDGSITTVPRNQVKHYRDLGAEVVQP